jgi:hypothetical protein
MQEKSMNEWSELFGLPYEIAWLGPPKWKLHPTLLEHSIEPPYEIPWLGLSHEVTSIQPFKNIQVNKWVSVCVCLSLSLSFRNQSGGCIIFSTFM